MFRILALLFLTIACAPLSYAQDSPPCFPEVTPECAQTPNVNDSDYGPTQISGGSCPRIPTSFPKVYQVSSFAEFNAAYNAVMPGEAIIVSNGVYTWKDEVPQVGNGEKDHPFNLYKNGTGSKPIYIISESLHGAVFQSSWVTLILKGSNHVISGFKHTSPTRVVYSIDAPGNRIACQSMSNGNNHYIMSESTGLSDNAEIDNNSFDGGNNGILFKRCKTTLTSCTNNSKGIHVHHNVFKNRPKDSNESIDHEAIAMGLAYYADDGVTIYNLDGNNMDMIVENNLFDGWNGEEELITVKSSRNIIRNNCIKNAPNSVINLRMGDHNLVTGNWHEGAEMYGHRISGKNNYIVFNYSSKTGDSGQAFRNHQRDLDGSPGYENLMAYVAADNNVVKNNVFNGFHYMMRIMPTSDAPQTPQGNLIEGNVLYSNDYAGTNSSGGFVAATGVTESMYRASNSWLTNTILGTELPVSSCGNKQLFSGPGRIIPGDSMLLEVGPIVAPSWW